MLKKSAFVSAAAAGVMMLGAPAWAGGGGHSDEADKWVHNESHSTMVENEDEYALVDTGDVLSGNAVPVCHNNVNVLGVQVADVANGLGLNVPIANDEPASNAEGGANCSAVTNSVEKDD